MCDQKIEEILNSALINQNLCDLEIVREPQTNVKDGFIGNVQFVKVTGRDKNNQAKILNLVLKTTKELEKFKEQRTLFLKEIYIYGRVKPSFDRLLLERRLELEFFPKCYATNTEENREFLVLEDLRPDGFKLWDKSQPLTTNHVKLILKKLASWHSLSFVLKKENPQIYENLKKDNVNAFTYIAMKSKCDFTMSMEFDSVKKIIFGKDQNDLLQFNRDDFRYAFSDLFLEDPEHHVFLHGDCWNNNFLFKYLDNDMSPTDVKIIDWQCSSLGSPVFDLSHFIYTCCDTGELENVEKILKIYYQSFSENLTLFGCDPVETFSFDLLKNHWKKYSKFGLFFSFVVVKMSVVSRKGWDYYLERAKNNLLHYCKNAQI